MSNTSRLKNAIRRLPDYWWLVQLLWVIALIGGILWLIWTTPSEADRYIYTGVFGSITSGILTVIIIGALPLGIILQAIKLRNKTRALLFGLGYVVAVIVILALLGPVIGNYYQYAVDDSIRHNGTTYVLVHSLSTWTPYVPTYYLLECNHLFKPCRQLHHFSLNYGSFNEFTQGSPLSKEADLQTTRDRLLVVVDGNIVYTYSPDR